MPPYRPREQTCLSSLMQSKELAISAMRAKYGDEFGKAYGFVMFSGYGIPGLVDGATLAARSHHVNFALSSSTILSLGITVYGEVASGMRTKRCKWEGTCTVSRPEISPRFTVMANVGTNCKHNAKAEEGS